MTGAPTPSLIMALHARYEAIWKAHGDIEEARPPEPPQMDTEEARRQLGDHWRAANALALLEMESDLIVPLVLLQMPADDQELTVLVYHAAGMSELASPSAEDQHVLSAGMDHILDYLVSEGRAPVELGECFRITASAAFHRVALRSGSEEELREIRPG